MLSSTVIIVSYLAFPKLRSTWRLYLTLLSAMDFMQGVFYFSNAIAADANQGHLNISHAQHVWKLSATAGCKMQAFFGMYSSTSSYLWTAGMAFFVHRLVRNWCSFLRGNMQTNTKGEGSCWYPLVALGYPLLIQVALLVTDALTPQQDPIIGYDDDDYGCFIRQKYPAWRYLGYYLPLWLSIMVTFVCYVAVSVKIRQMSLAAGDAAPGLVRIRRKMLLVPLAFLILRLPESIFRIAEAIYVAQGGDGPVANGTSSTSSSASFYASSSSPSPPPSAPSSSSSSSSSSAPFQVPPSAGSPFISTPLGQALLLLQAAFNPSQGTLNCLIFVWTSPTYRRSIDRLLRRSGRVGRCCSMCFSLVCCFCCSCCGCCSEGQDDGPSYADRGGRSGRGGRGGRGSGNGQYSYGNGGSGRPDDHTTAYRSFSDDQRDFGPSSNENYYDSDYYADDLHGGDGDGDYSRDGYDDYYEHHHHHHHHHDLANSADALFYDDDD
eukprot:g1387.t1